MFAIPLPLSFSCGKTSSAGKPVNVQRNLILIIFWYASLYFGIIMVFSE